MAHARVIDRFPTPPEGEALRKIPIATEDLGIAETVSLTIQVDRTFVPGLLDDNQDMRELGISVSHAAMEIQ